MQPLLGNRSLLSALRGAVSENRMAGCYLIEGADGTGKLTIARHIAASLSCLNRHSDGSACLNCRACRQIFSGSHIDVLELRPEEEGKAISVERVREMLKNTYILPSEGDWRIFIIEHSENMKKEAQNALLKSIEEPRNQTVFFLLTNDKTKLLPTVRSRCVFFRTEPLSDEEIFRALKNEPMPEDEKRKVALLSGGSLGKAKEMVADLEFLVMREKVLSYFQAIMDGAGFTRLSLIFPPAATTRKELVKLLPLIKLCLRDLIASHFGHLQKPEFFTDLQFLQDLSGIINPKQAMRLFDLTEELSLAMERNANLFSALSGFHLTSQKLTRP